MLNRRHATLLFTLFASIGIAVWALGSQPKPAVPIADFNSPAPCCSSHAPANSLTPIHASNPSKAPISVGTIFADFQAWAQTHADPTQTITSADLSRGLDLARQRKALLADLIESDPQRALAVALPVYLARRLPVELKPELETHIDARGDYLVTIATSHDADTPPEVTRSTVIDGQNYRAFVYGKRLGQSSKIRIPMHGIALGGKMAVHENPIRVLTAEEIGALDPQTKFTNVNDACGIMPTRKVPGRDGLGQGSAAARAIYGSGAQAARVISEGGDLEQVCCEACVSALSDQLTQNLGGPNPQSSSDDTIAAATSTWTTGPKNVLCIMADFTDAANTISPTTIQSLIDTSTNGFYSQTSYGLTSYKGTVTTLVHLPNDTAYYTTNYSAAMSHGLTAAQNAGYSMTGFDRYIVYTPKIGGGIAGVGRVGTSGVAVFGYTDLSTTAHELGHNLGVWHANWWNCTDGTVIGSGSNNEYGNRYSVMGSNHTADFAQHYDAYMKNYFGWLPSTNIATITSSGIYTLNAMDDASLSGSNKYALKISNPSKSNYYWVELRQRWTAQPWVMEGVEVYWSPWTSSARGTQILDTTPNSVSARWDSALVIGRTLPDPANGLYITPIAKTGTAPVSMQVVINMGSFPGNVAPTVTVNASATSVSTGTAVNFTATAADANNDTLAYYWDFGDNKFGTNSPSASHSWTASGKYLVRCVVTDMKGGQAQDSVIVTVGSPTTYAITGRVMNASSQGVEGVHVYVSSTKSTYTDSDGSYSLVGLAAGSYTVSAIKGAGYSFKPTFTNPVVVGPDAANMNFVDSIGTFTVSGTVTDGATGLAGVTVSAGGTYSASTNTSGSYTLYLPNGSYTLTPSKSGFTFTPTSLAVTVSGANLSGKNFTGTSTGNQTPTVATAAAATPNPVTNKTTVLSVLGADDGGEAALTYTWSASGPATVTYSANGTNAAKSSTATFSKAGSYTFTVTIKDAGNLTVTSTVTVVVNQTLTTITVSPASASVTTGGTQSFTASAKDQFGTAMSSTPTFTWTVSGGGTISSSGLFTAGGTAGGPFTVTASSGGKSGTAQVTITAPTNQPPVIDSAAGASPNPVVNANTTSVSVTAHDPDSGPAALTYTWSKVSGPGTVSFSPNGTTAASTSTATFGATGTYSLLVTVSDGAASVTSQITGLSVTLPNGSPTVATAAAATPNPVTNKTTVLSVLGADDGGEAALTYTWSASGPATVTYSANGTNAAKSSTATFSKAGSYTFTVTIKDAGNLTVTSTVTVVVNQTLTTITVSPASASVTTGGTQSFTASAKDQFGTAMSSTPTFTWTVSGGGTISSSGLFTAGGTAGGPFTVTASSGGKSGTAQVTITAPLLPPTILTQPLSQTVYAGQNVTFTVVASGTAPLTYQWMFGSTPVGTNSATLSLPKVRSKNAGVYTVIVSNAYGSVTSNPATLTVLKPIRLSRTSLSLTAGGGSTAPVADSVTMTNLSPESVTVDVSTLQTWLDATPDGSAVLAGGQSAALTVTANPAGLSGVLSGETSVADSATGEAQALPVTFSIGSTGTGQKRGGCAMSAVETVSDNTMLWLALLGILALATQLRRRQ